MSTRTQENIVAVAVLIFFAGYLLITLTLGPNARLVPMPIAVLGQWLTLPVLFPVLAALTLIAVMTILLTQRQILTA